MRIPRPRLSVRAAIVLVALSAVGLVAWEEFREGMPPRSTLRSIPGRIGRLKAGMTEAEAWGVLGMDRPWYLGGLETQPVSTTRLGRQRVFEHHFLLPIEPVPRPGGTGTGTIQLPAGQLNLHFEESAGGTRRLLDASYFDRDSKEVRMTKAAAPPG